MEQKDDGLPVSEVGEWAIEKHNRLRRYISITRGVRKKWLVPQAAGHRPAGATYIDLFCGPGRSRIRGTGQMIDGGPLVATSAAVIGGAAFSKVFLADQEASFVDAACSRLAARGVTATCHRGPAEETAKAIVEQLDPYGLHFAFLDPFNLGDLPFTEIEQLAKFKRMDMLIHVSVQDLQRNLRRYIAREGSALDRFAPNWRDCVDVDSRDEAVRASIFEHWRALLRGLGMQPSRGVELVTGERNQRLYWLVLISHHERADELWEKIRNTTGQGHLL